MDKKTDKNILETMKNTRLFFDGGLGTLLSERGMASDEKSDTWSILHPDVMVEVHREYLRAGANILNANTFCTNTFSHPDGSAYQVEALVDAAVANVRKAISLEPDDRPHFVTLDMGPTGQLLEPYGDVTAEEAYECYARTVKAGVKAGVDLILVETMIFAEEAECAVRAARECSDLPVFVTFSLDKNGRIMSGQDVSALASLAKEWGADAVGMNCGFGPDELLPRAREMAKVSELPIIVNPNAGLPSQIDGRTVYTMDAEHFSDVMCEIARCGGALLGGCCGTTPAYIKRTIEKITAGTF